MTRVLRLSRLSPLLLLAAALVALAVFFVNYNAPPASADHGRDTDVWSATLTAQSTQAGPGCSTAEAAVATKCSTVSTLTDNQFTYLGVDYTVNQISYSTPTWGFSFDQLNIPAAFNDLTLYVNNVRIPLADAAIVSGFGTMSVTGPSGSAISVGSTVQLKLVREYWTGVDLYDGDMVHTSDGAQYMDLDEGDDGTFMVRLDQAPTADVTITIGKLSTFGIDDFDAATVSPQTLTFTTANWQTGQEVTVSATTDGDGADDRIIISAHVSIAGSADSDDPYRNPERVNGFVLTVTDTTVGGG